MFVLLFNRLHKSVCGSTSHSVVERCARLRVFGQFATSVPGALESCQQTLLGITTVEQQHTNMKLILLKSFCLQLTKGDSDAVRRYWAPLQIDPTTLSAEIGGSARLALWRRQVNPLGRFRFFSRNKLFSLFAISFAVGAAASVDAVRDAL